MGLKYFNNNNWIYISREERLYCAHLYFQIRKDVPAFVEWLNEITTMNLPINCNWEIGYEVCLYRDYLYSQGTPIRTINKARQNPYPEKRTFDLCLFSEHNIVIIEAKVCEKFHGKQLNDMLSDVNLIKELLDKELNIHTLLLVQSKYVESKNFLRTQKNRTAFPYAISWKEMDELYPSDVFERADELK